MQYSKDISKYPSSIVKHLHQIYYYSKIAYDHKYDNVPHKVLNDIRKSHEIFVDKSKDSLTNSFDIIWNFMEEMSLVKDYRFFGEIHIFRPTYPYLSSKHFLFKPNVKKENLDAKFDISINYGTIYIVNVIAYVFSAVIMNCISVSRFSDILYKLQNWYQYLHRISIGELQSELELYEKELKKITLPPRLPTLIVPEICNLEQEYFAFLFRELIWGFLIGHEVCHSLTMESLQVDKLNKIYKLVDLFLYPSINFDNKEKWKEELICDSFGLASASLLIEENYNFKKSFFNCIERLNLPKNLIHSAPYLAAQAFMIGLQEIRINKSIYLEEDEFNSSHPSYNTRRKFLRDINLMSSDTYPLYEFSIKEDSIGIIKS
ncbi:hypothetical protein Q4Q35_13875 [Flavivirga aquimarina]|uniref:Peptidase M48 domain-containing protein n=1 Tax=Flavivirga aquimarina TaxID=2027862 RepID=A0ABT8WCM7_9FLAO|nr:hypothetical protein [Flavivirga aquimarina]MDO5970896.1 hypothetical protein [Flavivirga aquimarina]